MRSAAKSAAFGGVLLVSLPPSIVNPHYLHQQLTSSSGSFLNMVKFSYHVKLHDSVVRVSYWAL